MEEAHFPARAASAIRLSTFSRRVTVSASPPTRPAACMLSMRRSIATGRRLDIAGQIPCAMSTRWRWVQLAAPLTRRELMFRDSSIGILITQTKLLTVFQDGRYIPLRPGEYPARRPDIHALQVSLLTQLHTA